MGEIMLINYLKSFAWTFGIIIVGTLILSVFNYFGILTGIILKILKLMLPIVAIFIGSYRIGKVSTKKGYFEGLKYGLIWLLIFLTTNLILKSISLDGSIYFLILSMISMLGSMVGINRKKA